MGIVLMGTIFRSSVFIEDSLIQRFLSGIRPGNRPASEFMDTATVCFEKLDQLFTASTMSRQSEVDVYVKNQPYSMSEPYSGA